VKEDVKGGGGKRGEAGTRGFPCLGWVPEARGSDQLDFGSAGLGHGVGGLSRQ